MGIYRFTLKSNEYNFEGLENKALIGNVRISREDEVAILSGKVSAPDAKRVASMYKFDIPEIENVTIENILHSNASDKNSKFIQVAKNGKLCNAET